MSGSSPPEAREHWGSRFGFIVVTAGFAIGLGNIWRFPYVAGEHGGAAFLLVYLAFAILIGIPLFAAEVSLGRKAQLSPLEGMAKLVGRRSPWMAFVWLGLLTNVLIVANYVTLLSWIAGYLGMMVAGTFPEGSAGQIEASFAEFVARPAPILAAGAVLMSITTWIVSRGLTDGVERIARFAMPTLLLMLIGLAGRSVTLPGATEGLIWYLAPDFSALTPEAILIALGQAFYSIGVGMVVAFGLGSHLDPETSDIPGDSAVIVAADTSVAFLAGLVIFPALFAFGIPPDSGPTLLFVTMPVLFQQMPGGLVFGGAFLSLMLVAGLTSIVAVMEVLGAIAHDSLGWSRRKGVMAVGTVWFALSVPVVLSQGPWSGIRLLGRDLFGAVDYVIGTFAVPLGGLLLALYVATAWEWTAFRDETNVGSGPVKVNPTWRPFVQFLIPLAVLLVFLAGLGVLRV